MDRSLLLRYSPCFSNKDSSNGKGRGKGEGRGMTERPRQRQGRGRGKGKIKEKAQGAQGTSHVNDLGIGESERIRKGHTKDHC